MERDGKSIGMGIGIGIGIGISISIASVGIEYIKLRIYKSF